MKEDIKPGRATQKRTLVAFSKRSHPPISIDLKFKSSEDQPCRHGSPPDFPISNTKKKEYRDLRPQTRLPGHKASSASIAKEKFSFDQVTLFLFYFTHRRTSLLTISINLRYNNETHFKADCFIYSEPTDDDIIKPEADSNIITDQHLAFFFVSYKKPHENIEFTSLLLVWTVI